MKLSESFCESWAVAELIAAALFVAIGPFVWMYRLAAADRFLPLAAVGLAWLASLAILGFEAYRKALSVVSLGVVIAWFVVLAFALYATA